MARNLNKNDPLSTVHSTLDQLTFSMFTKDEIQQLAVTRIHTPLTLDSLGHPLPGGLYDKTLGPLTEKSEPCGTCRRNYLHCPGHFGYIELPLPVVNPLFHHIIGTILRCSCLSCYHIQIPAHIKYAFSLQIKLLNSGLVTAATEIAVKVAELIATYQSLENIPKEELASIEEYDKIAKAALEELDGKYVLNKNTEALRNQFVYDLLFETKKLRQICMFCKKPMDRIKAYRNKIVISTNIPVDKSSSSRIRAYESHFLNPEQSRQHMQNIFKVEGDLMKHIISVLTDIEMENPTDVFYCDVIPVIPSNCRPVNIVNKRVAEPPQTQAYKTILQQTIILKLIIQVVNNKGNTDKLSVEAKGAYNLAHGATPIEKLNNAWETLQYNVDGLLDSSRVRLREGEGLKQVIEKKAGIIRMHMMGKRVNFSARSVITPDPNLNIDEIGIPEAFAKHLTYPVPVTVWNVEELRKMIMNGPDVHPGAVMVEYEDGTIKRINTKNSTQQESILKRLLTPDDKEAGFRGVKRVHRHLCNGDILLLNRQPTLHKPSIMAHTARILKGEKTLRLHYANCKAYNADFDGDEMNAHFPQNELSRSEAYNIVNVSNQYLVPKDGTPLSGLIQDHMISGVRLTMRGRFFDQSDYHQLVFQALASFKTGSIRLLPPAIIKPVQLWSGKQILSTVLINVIPEGKQLINLTSTAKIGAKTWETQQPREWKAGGIPFKTPNIMSETEVVIRNGELLVGVLDKTHYGATPYGLIHCIYELYGGNCATRLLSAFTKLFMRFLQQEGFTLGVHDILVVEKSDAKRQKIIKRSRKIGLEAITTALDLPIDTPVDEIVAKIEEQSAINPKLRSVIDRQYKTLLDSYTNKINKTCLPAGLICKFPYNNLQLMVQSGAKGTTVNTMQISCLLGQIELEGKRPPVMICGKSLPSFPIFEFQPRAGGFIDGRFMTGIQPQEFFFHCMAGREGLIDTAVKTSRSGYLQRCLIKHLEGLSVGYDMTVRDSDKSVVQFLYGEDGMDISKAQFLNEKQLNFLAENKKALVDKDILKQLEEDSEQEALHQYQEKLKEWHRKFENAFKQSRRTPFALFSTIVKKKLGTTKFTREQMMNLWDQADDELKNGFREECERCPDPVNSIFQSDHHFGSINERIEALMERYETKNINLKKKDRKQFENMLKMKSMTALCAPGEPVGLLAAQSIGEPSTQMTLNTFHFAGRGEMNVTLGIPRLREILMMASKSIKTPSMEIPFLQNIENLEERAENLRKMLTKVVIENVLEKIDVTAELEVRPVRQHCYTLKFHFLPHKLYKNDYYVNPKSILRHMSKRFFGEMFAAIRKVAKTHSNLVMIGEKESVARRRPNNDEDGEIDDEVQNSADKEQNVFDEDHYSSSDEEERDYDQEPEENEKEATDDENDEANEGATTNTNNKETSDDTNENEDKKQEHGEDTEVVAKYNFAKNYIYDKKKHLWCELTFALPLSIKKLDLTAILKDVAAKSVVWETANIRRAITYMKDDQLVLRTDGINILKMFKHHKLLDLNRLYCNDIHKMAETYGIEAAMKIIVKEVQDVFNVYGIKVDPRHLSLVADYMTFNGTFEPLSRKGMESSASPLQQMSFESSLTFMKHATVGGKTDNLDNPSSCLIVGKLCRSGTGAFDLRQTIPVFNK